MSMNTKNSKQRRYPRVSFPYSLGLLAEGKYLIRYGHELGEGGVSMIFPRVLPVAKKIVVTLSLESGHYACLLSEVRSCSTRSNGYLIGLQFLDISFENKKKIRQYVSNGYRFHISSMPK